jgi:hypothetical protein
MLMEGVGEIDELVSAKVLVSRRHSSMGRGLDLHQFYASGGHLPKEKRKKRNVRGELLPMGFATDKP